MTTTANQTAEIKPPARFGFFAPRPAAAAPAPAAASAPADTTQFAATSTAVAQQTTVNAAPVQEDGAGTEIVAGATAEVPAVATEEITVMLPSGGRQGQVFGGVFGRMEDGKFRTDPLLKPIPLLQLVDGAELGTQQPEDSELMQAMGGAPETITITVPAELSASLKATLAHTNGARWDQLYAQSGAYANAITKFALQNEARNTREAVAQAVRTGGEIFTVQVAEPKELRFMMEDEGDGYGSELEGVPQPVAGAPVTTAVAGAVANAAAGRETLHSAFSGRQEGDTVTYTHIELFTVLADSAENAQKVLALVPQSLKAHTALSASDVMVNGQPYVQAGPLLLEEEAQTADVPR